MSLPNATLPILSLLTAATVVLIGLAVYFELVFTLLDSVGNTYTR